MMNAIDLDKIRGEAELFPYSFCRDFEEKNRELRALRIAEFPVRDETVSTF